MAKVIEKLKMRSLAPSGLTDTLLFGGLMFVSGCTTTNYDEMSVEPAAVPVVNKMTSAPIDELSGTNVNQISKQDISLNASQIPSTKDQSQLTVEQLKTYIDRCAPNAGRSAPTNIDCSELSLRVKKAINNDDKVSEALLTLGRLSRHDNARGIDQDLKDGRASHSIGAQAVAGGLLDTPPEAPIEPTLNIEDFLAQNGLAINAGIIVANPQ